MTLTRLILFLVGLLLAAGLASLVYGKEPALVPSNAADDLKRYYADSKSEPPWKDAISALSSSDAKRASEAASYLRALLKQALQDEASGTAPWRATPFWGSSGENPARILRERILSTLAAGAVSESALSVLRYYLEEEPMPALQEKAAKALSPLSSKEAASLRSSLVSTHENAFVVTELLHQITLQKETLPAATLAALCEHHRANIREAARALHLQQGGAKLAAFDPIKAIQSATIQKLFQEMGAMLSEAPPTKAPFVLVKIVAFDQKGKQESEQEARGWLLREDGDKIEILTPFGWREEYQLQAKPGKCPEYGHSCTIERIHLKIEEEVERVKKLRAQGDPKYELSERGGLTGQFQGNGAGLYEAMLGYWLVVSKKDELAAQIVLPALETLYRDSDLLLVVQHRLGLVYGYQMLSSFAGDRDYERTEKLAKLLIERFPKSRFSLYAERFVKELPKRKEDFTTLTLPTPEEWQTLESTLTREQKIEYLAQRIRLLNCFQDGQPGGISYYDTQHKEPSGISRDAAWGAGRGKTRVINPVLELLGPMYGYEPSGKIPLSLTIADIPQLVPYLREDWLLLTVSFWRDFHPDRNLHSTREIFAMVINKLANQEICNPAGFDKMTPKEQNETLQKIIDWAKANATRSEAELLLQALEDALREKKRWYDIEAQAKRLVEKKEPKAIPLLLRFLETKDATDLTQQSIFLYCRQIDPSASRKTASLYLKKPTPGVQLEAALTLFAAGERSDSIRVLGEVLGAGDDYNILHMSSMAEAVLLLLGEGSTASQKAAARVLSNPKLPSWDNQRVRAALMQHFTNAGYPDGYAFYRKMLELKGNQLGQMTYGQPLAERFAQEITEFFAPEDAGIIEIKKKYPTSMDQIEPLKKWLTEKEKASLKGKAS